MEQINFLKNFILPILGISSIIATLAIILIKFLEKFLLEKIKLEFGKDLKSVENDLAILKEKKIKFSNKQAKLYSGLWSELYNLKLKSDKVFANLTPQHLERFSKALLKAETKVQEGSLFIETNDYIMITNFIEVFKKFEIGKLKLIEFRIANTTISENESEQLSELIKQWKSQLDTTIYSIRDSLKEQLSH